MGGLWNAPDVQALRRKFKKLNAARAKRVVAKKTHAHKKTVVRKRTLVRPKKKKVTKKSNTSNPNTSTFVKCVDRRLNTKLPYLDRFARKVMMATLPQYALRTDISEFTMWGKAGPYANASTDRGKQVVGWTQIAFDHLQTTYTTQVQSSYFCDKVDVNQGAGLALTYQTQAGGPSTTSGYENQVGAAPTGVWLPPSIRNKYEGVAGATAAGIVATQNARFWQGSRTMQLELRNPQQFGMRLNIYYVRARNLMPALGGSQGAAYNLSGVYTGYGATGGINWAGQSNWSWTPLESYIYGMWRKGINPDQVGAMRHLGLNDSTDFKQYWQTKSVCSVYIPPGGTMFKTFTHKKSRVMDTTYIANNVFDRHSTYIVIKCIPEVQILPQTPALTGGVAKSEVAILNQPGDSGATAPDLSVGLPDYHWIASVSIRDQYRLLPSFNLQDTFRIESTIPVGQHSVGGQGPYKQNNDIGTRSTTSVAP